MPSCGAETAAFARPGFSFDPVPACLKGVQRGSFLRLVPEPWQREILPWYRVYLIEREGGEDTA